ncbi:DUF3558 family protein [Saccharomonospora iraqiensis]|uniref:DUF3558 family protein n=1 Tax=Saccharomonospora iraqiensis TaxID=52698 RepID=UPI000A0680C5|nr:DUF3558 family protein [Saccharomonospora iraqiensis]
MNRAGFASVFGILLLGLSACSSSVGGEANPSRTGGPSRSATQSTPGMGTDGNSVPDSLADIAPCSLLSNDELSEYGTFPPGERDDRGVGRACRFQRDRDPTEPGRVVAVNLREEQGVGDVIEQGYGVQRAESNGRKYAQVPSAGACLIAIGVTSTSRVDIHVVATEGRQKSCEIADEIGAIVEPKLPKG